MKNKILLAFLAVVLFSSCGKINDELDALGERLDKLETKTIPDIDSQIESINISLSSLEQTDKKLNEYIEDLQTADNNLTEAIGALDIKIDEVKAELNGNLESAKKELNGNIATAKADVLAQLEALRTEMLGIKEQIDTTISLLQEKDLALEGKIDELRNYVDTELADATDWAEATFATLEQYNAIVEEIAAIKSSIETLNKNLTDMEERLNNKIANDIATATNSLNATIQQQVKEITDSYTAAISTAKSEITEAYQAAIQSAIATSESNMKNWVGEQLSGYYDISEVDALLNALEATMDGKLSAQKTYFEELIGALSQTLVAKIDVNTQLIAELRDDLTTLDGEVQKNTELIADNAEKISKNAEDILANAKNISANSDDIEANKTVIARNAELIAENSSLISELENKIDNTCDAANARAIAENAAEIAKNAELIAQNAVAISNNTTAISNNTAEIAVLKADLAASKSEITTAYQEAIAEAIEQLDGKLSSEINSINSRLDQGLSEINTSIAKLEGRVATLESDVTAIKATIASILKDIADMQEDIADLMARVQSISYIPKYDDGKASMDYMNKVGEFDFSISPKSVIPELEKIWNNVLSMKGVYTETRGVEFVELPITSFAANTENGTISIKVSGENLSAEFYKEFTSASVALNLSDGNSSLVTEYIPIVPNYNIQFEDLYVKSICCRRWDTNNDGELSYDEAAAVTGIGRIFEKSSIIAFTELKYFTGLTTIPNNAFSECTRLWKIVLPDSITWIGNYAFQNCSKLQKINIPNGVTFIGNYAFQNCSKLQKINIPNGVTSIGSNAFDGCNGLTSVTIPDSVTSIGKLAFSDCTGLTSVTIPDSVTSIGNYAFSGFSGTVYCKPTIPPSVTDSTIYLYLFTNSPGSSISYLIIYVPIGSGQSYKNAPVWREYASKIVEYNFEE